MTVTQATIPPVVDSGLLRACLLIIMALGTELQRLSLPSGSVALRPSFTSLTWSQLMRLGLPAYG